MSKINGIETEWTQLQRKMGNLPELPEEDEEEINEEDYKTERQKLYESLQTKSLNQLNEMEDERRDDDDDEGERMFEELRRKRLMEMKQKAQRNKYRGVYEISAPEYVNEICKTTEDVWVVVHLFAPGKDECKVFDQICNQLSQKHTYAKFVKIRGNAAIANFPDRNCPMILLYTKGRMVSQWIGLQAFGGMQNISADNVEWRLHKLGALDSDMTEPPSKFVADGDSKQTSGSAGSFNFVGETYGGSKTTRRSYRDDDDDVDDYDDEY